MNSIAVEEALQNAYKTLAECYYDPSTQPLPETLQDFAERLMPLGPEIAEQAKALADSFSQSDKQDLLVDFARLFVGPFEVLAPPYGSYYIDKQMMGDSTIEIKDFYEQAGLEMSSDFDNLPDHISAELEFLYYLVFNEIHALKQEEDESVFQFRELRTNFLKNHLSQWACIFTKNIEQHAQSTFYKQLAKITNLILSNHKSTTQ